MSEVVLHTHLAAHTSRAEPRCHPAGHRWGPRSTGWRRRRWHKVHGCRWWSSTLLSEDARQSWWDQEIVLITQNQTMGNWTSAYLSLLLWELHIVKDPEDNSKQILPPVFLKGVPIGLHHFEHHCQSPGNIDPQAHVGNFPLITSTKVVLAMRSYLVLTSSLHLLMMQDSSKRIGNHPRTHTRSSVATFMSSLV